MDLSIIIVNWNSKDFLIECISSLIKNLKEIEYEIIVIDSGSFDGCDKILDKWFPNALFIQSTENIGFAKANNKAFLISKGKIILFLNPDTIAFDDSIFILYKNIESLDNAGIVAPVLLNSDFSFQQTCIRAFPKIFNQLLTSELLVKFFPYSKIFIGSNKFRKNDVPFEVEAVSGACLMIKRDLFVEVGLFSEDYFMYSEDIDLCRKVYLKSYNIYHVPMAKVLHYGGGSTENNSISKFSDIMMVESRLRYFKKFYTPTYSLLYKATIFISGLCRISLIIIGWPAIAIRRNAQTTKNIMSKWIHRMRWVLGFEKRI